MLGAYRLLINLEQLEKERRYESAYKKDAE